jgi:hypothetical protein
VGAVSDLVGGRFVLGAYWGPREESLETCARRLVDCLQGMSEISPVFDGWYRKGASKAAASRQPVGSSLGQLADLLDSGRHRKDLGGDVMTELGFNAALWNRQKGSAAAWSVTCGAFPAPGVEVSNAFVIDWPERAPGVTVEDDLAVAKAVMRVVVQEWEPDWATWASRAMRDLQQVPPRHPTLGLLTYFGPRRNLPRVGLDVVVEPLDGGRLLIVEPAASDLPKRLLRLREALTGTEALQATC